MLLQGKKQDRSH